MQQIALAMGCIFYLAMCGAFWAAHAEGVSPVWRLNAAIKADLLLKPAVCARDFFHVSNSKPVRIIVLF
ncbi:MAG: hypothetical protein PHQ65_16235 [Bacteroidales bacterium]|nr:hypothetical protein [Bacteroidales bacterium]MDD3666816.1 hypothetical protein [Bacteroidales bacterium]